MTMLAELSTTEVAETDFEVAVVPTGSTEQHGPALPLGTDTIIANHLASTVSSSRSDVVCTPPIPVGVSAHHRHFEGTLWVGEETFRRYVEAVIRSLASHGVDRTVIVNGHGGNTATLRRVGQQLRSEEVAYAAPWNWWEATDALLEEQFDTEGGHAGHGETSMMLAIEAGHVDRDRLADAESDAPPGWGRRIHGADVGFDTIDFTPTGAVGEPTKADEAVGREILTSALDELEAFIDWLRARSNAEVFANTKSLHPPG